MTQSTDSKLSNYQNLEELLKITVETTRKTLKCDRVIIYDASELPQVEVIAEAVDPKYASILGQTIIDPFLEGDYLENYCYGQAIAIENTYTADVNKNQLENLKKFKIKSLAIAPISAGNKLLAFLVAHQCSRPQPWHPEAVKLLTEKANITSFALANIIEAEKQKDLNFTKQATEIQRRNSAGMDLAKNGNGKGKPTEQKTKIQENISSSFADVNGIIANQLGQENILKTTVHEVRHLLNCDRVVVYSLDQDNYGVVVAESVAAGLTKSLGKSIDDPCFAARYIEKYSQGRVRAWNDIYSEDITPCYLEQLEALEVKAKIVTPIIRENELFGLLIAHQCNDTRNWQEQEIHWITEIATQVGIMLDYNEIFAETDREEQKLLAASENLWNQHFTDAIQYIRQSITKEDILNASVKEVRRVLKCDRVVVYSMNSDNHGMIVAESVAPGWTKAQGRVINDPCFAAKYIDMYRDGRVRAWGNIYESGLTQCYVEQLEQLEVKANLVTPILNEGKLFGLLVAHQCSATRDWQQPEVRWMAQIATQVGFALDNAKLLADAKQLQHQLENEAQLTKYYTDAVRYIRESLHKEDILEISVEEVRRVLNCDRVVIYSMKQDDYGTIVAESVAPGWTRSQGRVINDPCFKVRYIEHYRSGRVRAWGNIYESGLTKCYIEQLEQLEVKANLAIPIISEGQLFGLLFAHQCSDFREWQQQEIRWATQIATQVGFALDNAELLANAKLLQQQVKDESKWTDYFTDATQHIRASLKTGDILNTSVKEVRRIL
ncbi:guanylate cyclase, partial [Pleurocapsa sp. CCALA 161]|uniref:GAF domain-containing protein n=1 Tax=Pleurocapsa sp. CCALA 161 TaxID=2107688 RepID=UPI000D3F4902